MTDHNQIINDRATAHGGIVQRPTINAGIRANLDVILNHHPAPMRHRHMGTISQMSKTKTTFANASAGQDSNAITQQGVSDTHLGANAAVSTDANAMTDNRVRLNPSMGANLSPITNPDASSD
jgi:hypothetical protein